MNLNEFNEQSTAVNIDVARVVKSFTRGGNGKKREKLNQLWLKKIIPVVTGLQTASDTGDAADAELLEAYDVEWVRIAERDFNAKGIDFKADGTGTIKTDELFFDVSQSGEVWLTSTPLADFGRQRVQERKNGRVSITLQKMRDHKVKAAFTGTDLGAGEVKETPESVAEGDVDADTGAEDAGKAGTGGKGKAGAKAGVVK